jgi:hypothetical protein
MTSQISCPEASELRELLDGTLAEPRKSELSGHLESCADCQHRLEGLVAGRESWTGVASQLQQEEPAASPALKQAVAEAAQPATGTATADTPPASDDQSLEFLDPPSEPGHLGRLAKYEVLEVIGRGGMGIVLKAFDESLHRVVAVKVMAPQLATSAVARQRFVREVQAAAAVRDEQVVAIYAVEEAKGLPFFVMEYIGGQSLQERLDRTGPLEVKEILRIGVQAARGLAAAHAQGLIHRDVKPANILLENGVQRVKLTDFGLARAADDASLTQSGVVAGTPQYMAPEQAESRTLDHRADLFSLGSVLYTMCTGRAPFRASTPMAVLKRVCDDTPRPVQEVNADIPDWLASIVVRLHAKDPARRYQSAAEVAEEFGQHLARYQQPTAPPPAAPRRPPRWRRRSAVVASALAVIAIAALLFGSTIRRYVANQAEVRANFSDPDARVLLCEFGREVAQLSAQSPSIALPPGSYEVVVVRKPTQFIRHFLIGFGRLGGYYFELPNQRYELTLGRGQSAEISFVLDYLPPDALKPGETNPPFTLDDSPPKSKSLRVLKAFGPDDKPITQDNIKPEEGGWRIDRYTLGVTTEKQPAVRTTAVVRLFEVDGPTPEEGELIFRAKMKSTPNHEGTLLVAALHMFYVSENKAVGASGWANYEVRYPLHLLRQRDARGPIPLNLGFTGHGTVWIKDIELLYAPPPAKTPPELRPGEVLVKAFGPGDVPITKSMIDAPVDLLNETHREREGWWYDPARLLLQPARLYEVHNPNVDGCRVIMRAMIKTFAGQGAYPVLVCRLQNGGEICSEMPRVIARGDTNWTTYETAVDVPPGSKSDRILVNMDFVPANQRAMTERAGIKEVVLLKAPLRSAAKDAAREPVKLKSFKPGTDTPLVKPDKIEDNAWRFDHATANTRLFELRDGLPEGGEFIYRAKLKTRTEQTDFMAALMLGEDFPSTFKSGEVVGPQVKGQKPEWSEYEARYPVHGLIAADPTTIRMNLRSLGAGTVWIKDIELWHVPPEPPFRRPGEVLFKRFGPKDKPISNDYRTFPTDGWQYEVTAGDRRIRLFEIQNPDIQNCRLVLRARVRTEGPQANVRLQLVSRCPNAGDVPRESKSLVAAEGNTNWTDYETSMEIKDGGWRPDVIELAVQAKGTSVNISYKFAIKDIELLKAPLKP